MATKTLFACFVLCPAASSLTMAEPALSRTDPAAVGMSAGRLEKIGAALRSEIDNGSIPGAVVGIARRGKLVYYEAFGFLDKGKASRCR